jgi:putative membrane protein
MISESEIIIKSGVFSRKQRNIPIERVQNVNVKQDLLQRILGIAKIQIETAGDVSSEGVLEYVKLKDADEINRVIRIYQQKIKQPKEFTNSESYSQDYINEIKNSETYNPSLDGDVLYEMSRKDLVTYGMIRLRPLFLIYGIWAMSYITQFKSLNDFVVTYLGDQIDTLIELPIYYLIPIGLVFLLSSVLISWLIDIIWTFTQFYGFRLIKDGNKLFTSYGLLSKHSITIPLKKLQQITISTNPVKKKFNFYTMILLTAGFDVNKQAQPSAVPLAKLENLLEISSRVYPIEIPDNFQNISYKSIRRIFIKFLIYVLPIIVALSYFADIYYLGLLLLVPGLYYLSYLRWKYRAYRIHNNTIYVKYGIWNQKLCIIPIEKIQTLHIKENYFQRRLSLSSILIDTASSYSLSDAYIPDIDNSIAVQILNEINESFRSYYKSNTI